jgi:hypothetical protein
MDKAVSAVTKKLPGATAAKKRGPGKTGAGAFALAAGVAGLAFKNRDKLPGRSKSPEPAGPATYSTPGVAA